MLYLSAFFEATRRDYYERLRNVTERGDWGAWLEYFLNGVARQSEDALGRAERINELFARWRHSLSGARSQAPLLLIDSIGVNPFLTPRGAESRLNLAYNTVMRAIAELERRRILRQVGEGKRGRVFCAQAILDILEEPAVLKPLRG